MSSIDVIINVYNETSMKKVRGMASESKQPPKEKKSCTSVNVFLPKCVAWLNLDIE